MSTFIISLRPQQLNRQAPRDDFINVIAFFSSLPSEHRSHLAVIIDELDSGVFECLLNFDQSRNVARERSFLAFNTPNGCNANFSRFGNILLAPAEKRPGCTELCHLKHALGELFD